jgi:hypothetical protein
VPWGFFYEEMADSCTVISSTAPGTEEPYWSASRRGPDSFDVAGPSLLLEHDGVSGAGARSLRFADVPDMLARQECGHGPCEWDTVRLGLRSSASTAALAKLIDVLRPAKFRRIVFFLHERIVEERPIFGRLHGVRLSGLVVSLEPTRSDCVPIVPNEPLEELIDRLLEQRRRGRSAFCAREMR